MGSNFGVTLAGTLGILGGALLGFYVQVRFRKGELAY